jgi:TRAP-type transport system small permease protein
MDLASVDRILDRVSRLSAAVAMVLFIGMLLSTGAQVLFRYVLQISVGWTEELARVLFVLSMFLGIAVAIREKEHIVVDFLFKKLPFRARTACGLIFNVAIFLFLVSLLRGAVRMAGVMWESYYVAMTWLSMGWMYAGECLAIAVMMLFVGAEIGRGIRDLSGGVARGEGAP